MEPAVPSRDPAIGARFRVEEKLAEDASGELHRGIEIATGEQVVVCILRFEGGAARRDRTLRETRRAAQVKHEGLAPVLEVGQTAGGDVFVVSARGKGERLADRLSRGVVLDEREAAEIALQIARALAAAHDAGVVHRELRPSVIVLREHDGAPAVTVEELATPRIGAVDVGDPEASYAAPEQRAGEPLGRRADVYSIGAILRAMLTGSPTDAGHAPIGSALGDVMRRCLAEDPRERFLDTVALGAALRAALDATRTSTPPVPSTAPGSSVPPAVAERSPASGGGASQRPAAISARPAPPAEPPSPAGRAPAAPPPRPLGRPLTSRPRWEEVLLDLRDSPLPRVALTAVLAFVIARVLAAGIVPFAVAVVAGVAAYATKYWRR